MLYRTLNPSTGELLAEYLLAGEKDLEQCLEQSAQGFAHWKSLSFDARAKYLNEAAALLEKDADQLAGVMSLEMGKPLAESKIEVGRCVQCCRAFAESAEYMLRTEQRAATDGMAEVRFEPLGPLLAIMPWNFPFWQVFRCAVPALMSGNTVILKHAPNTPRCALAIAEIFEKADVPQGVFQSIFLSNEQAAAVLADRRLSGVSLTGSVRAGKEVARQAGASLKRCVLELGGSDPFIVLGDADPAETAKTAASFRCMNNGQSCISPKRFFIEKSLYQSFESAFIDAMSKRVLGDPMNEKTENGPLAREDLRETLRAQVEKSISQGAKLRCGGQAVDGPGFFFEPAVLTDTGAGNAAREEELFGPVGVLIPFSSEQELIRLANDSRYGLGASVWSKDAERATYIGRALEVGNVYLNSRTRSDPMLPFGGMKESGIGRELGREGIREFVNVKTIWREC